MNNQIYYKAQIRLNLIIVSFTIVGIIFMLTTPSEPGSLQAEGLENLKFYTVLSNVFCGIVSLIYVFFILAGRDTAKLSFFKLAAVCGVAITFAVVAFFSGRCTDTRSSTKEAICSSICSNLSLPWQSSSSSEGSPSPSEAP